MKNDNWQKRGLAVLFLLAALFLFVKSTPITHLKNLLSYVRYHRVSTTSMADIREEYVDSLPVKNALIEVNGALAKALGMKGYYSDLGMYVLDGNYIISVYEKTSTDYEVEQMVNFRDFLEEQGIQLLYVNLPIKYTSDENLYRDYGIESYGNRNADLFLNRIEEAGINTLDLRTNIREDQLDVRKMFFRTDHHWTPDAGRWAAGKISEKLNAACGYQIDTRLYDQEKFSYQTWEQCWLGEQGRKVSKAYVGLDDYTLVRPKFETDYSFKYYDGAYAATFDNFIWDSTLNTDGDVYDVTSWYYTYHKTDCINNKVNDGKILMLGDSYFQVLEPFLSLGVHETDALCLREQDDMFSLREHILENDYDTIVICYAQFMIGAHDDPESSNYKIFDFSR